MENGNRLLPEQDKVDHQDHPASSEQEYFTVSEAANLLGVDRRSVLRYILVGIAGPNGQRIKLPAKLLRSKYGQEYQVGQSNLHDFMQARSSSVQDRRPVKMVSGAQLVAGELELERQHLDLQMAMQVIKDQAKEIEHLAIEKGELVGENMLLREQLCQIHARERQGLLHRLLVYLFGQRHSY